MHVRFSTCIGTPIVCDSLNEVVGQIYDVLIHPDTGTIEGFYVIAPSERGVSFLASLDIIRWGTQVHIQYIDAIYPLEDRIRLQPLLEDKRRILSQRIQTESGKTVGSCKDIQFSTTTMKCEWLFAKKWWRWTPPISIADVLEVFPRYILVKDSMPLIQEDMHSDPITEVLEALPDIASLPKTREGRK